jgi:hypothetical protein
MTVSGMEDKKEGEKDKTHVHGVATGRDLASVALGQSPVEGVGQGVLAEVGEKLLIDLESGKVG